MIFNYDVLHETNIRGKNIRSDEVNFSFFFSNKGNNRHAIRVKIVWNREKMGLLTDKESGYMELFGDYEYHGYNPGQNQVQKAREFFQKYKILLVAVWEGCLLGDIVVDYFRKFATFEEVVRDFELANAGENKLLIAEFISLEQNPEHLAHLSGEIRKLKILEEIVRKQRFFNLN